MTPQAFLYACADIEQAIGDLYRRLSGRLAPDVRTAELFHELAEQEDAHARAMQLVARLMRGIKDGTTVKDRAATAVRVVRDGLDRAKAMLEEGRGVTAEAALRVSIRIESGVLEAHGSNFIETDNEELRGVVQMLTTDTAQHKGKLEALLRAVQEARG